MPVTSTGTMGRDVTPPSRQVVLRNGAARVVLAILDVRGVDRLWKLTGRGTPARVDAGLEWEHRTATADPVARSVRLPAGGIDVVIHDSRHAGQADLDATLGDGPTVAAVVFVDGHSVDVVDSATARDWAAGQRSRYTDPIRRRLTRLLFDLAATSIETGIDVRTVYCGSVLWDLLAGEAAPGEPTAACYDDPAVLRGRYPFVRHTDLAEDELRFAGPHTLSGYRYIRVWLPVARALTVGAATDVMADLGTVTEYNRLRAAGAEPGDAAATAGAADATWKRRRAARLGIDVDNSAELSAFANIGLTVAAWRETALEILHSGWTDSDARPDGRLPPTTDPAADAARTLAIAAHVAAGGGIPDALMLRLNTWTQHQVATYVTARAVDLAAVRALLSDTDRVLQVGAAALRAGDFFGDRFADLTDSVVEACERLARHAHREGGQALVYALAISGLAYASDWWGTPYWADTVNRLPPHLLDMPARHLLTHTPWLLTSGQSDQIVWTQPFEDAKTDAKRAWSSSRDSSPPTLYDSLVI
jgi:hypothetical protein